MKSSNKFFSAKNYFPFVNYWGFLSLFLVNRITKIHILSNRNHFKIWIPLNNKGNKEPFLSSFYSRTQVSDLFWGRRKYFWWSTRGSGTPVLWQLAPSDPGHRRCCLDSRWSAGTWRQTTLTLAPMPLHWHCSALILTWRRRCSSWWCLPCTHPAREQEDMGPNIGLTN